MKTRICCLVIAAVIVSSGISVLPVISADHNIIFDLMIWEVLSDEASISVINDLDLSGANTLAKTYGYDIVWSSSNEIVLKINGEIGTVSRKDIDVRVTLTARIQNTSSTKEFPLTVKGVFADVSISDNFYYLGYEGKVISETPLMQKGFDAIGNHENKNFEVTLTDDYTVKTHRVNPDKNDYRTTTFNFSNSPKAVIFQARMKFEADLEVNTDVKREVFFYVYGKTSTNSFVKLFEFRFVCDKTNGVLNVHEAKNPSIGVNLGRIPPIGEWFEFTLSVDTTENTYDVYINDERMTRESRTFQDEAKVAVKLSYLSFNPYREAEDFVIHMDELAVCYPIPGLTFGSPVFSKIETNGQTLIPYPGQGLIRTEIPVRNTSPDAKQIALAAAVYDKSTKKLIDIDTDTQIVNKQSTLACEVDMSAEREYKYFLWESFDNLVPHYRPMTAPFGVKTESAGINGKLGVKLSWTPAFNTEENAVEQYIIYRDKVEIARVSGSAYEYVDFNHNAFIPQEYEIESSSVYGKRSERVAVEHKPQPVYCEPVEVIDNATGRIWRYFDFFGESVMRSYFTQQSWTADNERFIFSDENKFIYTYNTKTFMIQKIGEYFAKSDFTLMTMAPKSNNFYFVNPKRQIIKMDMDTYEETVVVQLPEGIYWATDLGVSIGEKIISINCYIHAEGIPVDTRIAWYDVEKDKLNLDVWRDFTEIDGEGYYSMHPSINPVYTDMLLYCSGGTYTGPEPYRSFTRIWMHNIATGEDYNFFKQYQLGSSPEGINYGEQNCHETWTSDGEYLVINKATSNPRFDPLHIGYAGIVLLDKNGRDRRYLGMPKTTANGTTYDLYLTHPGASASDPRWVVVDQTYNFLYNMNHWPIYLLDVESGKWQLIANPPHNGESKFHPHPSTSQDGNIVIFGVTSENDKGRIGWMDISDLVNVPQDGQRIWLSDSCEVPSYAGFEYEVEAEQVNDEQAYRIREGKKMYLNVNNDVVWGVKQDVTLTVTYMDSGTQPIKLEYFVWMDEQPTHRLDPRSLNIDRAGTNQWKTAILTLDGINLDNMELLGTDMKLSGVDSDVLIKEITAH